MDNFNVPEKVNRHVLKALNILSNGNCLEGVTTTRILNQVKFQMRNLCPVPNIDTAVKKSLKNMSEIGQIKRHGLNRYAIGHCYATDPPAVPSPRPNITTGPDPKLFHGTDNRKRSRSDLDPNQKRKNNSDDSLSGDDFDKTRKRMRSNNSSASQLGFTPPSVNSNLEFLLDTLMEVTKEIKKIIGVREVPPPLVGPASEEPTADDSAVQTEDNASDCTTSNPVDAEASEGNSPIDTCKPVQLDDSSKREAPGTSSEQAEDSAQVQKAATSKRQSSPTPFYIS